MDPRGGDYAYIEFSFLDDLCRGASFENCNWNPPPVAADPGGDVDVDGVPNGIDNCPTIANADQKNCDAEGEADHGLPRRGDACDPNPCPTVGAAFGGSGLGRAPALRPPLLDGPAHAELGDRPAQDPGREAQRGFEQAVHVICAPSAAVPAVVEPRDDHLDLPVQLVSRGQRRFQHAMHTEPPGPGLEPGGKAGQPAFERAPVAGAPFFFVVSTEREPANLAQEIQRDDVAGRGLGQLR